MFEEEVSYLRNFSNMKDQRPFEWEVISDICVSLERGDFRNFVYGYYDYYSIARNDPRHNEEAYNRVKDIYNKLDAKFKKI